MTSVRIYQPSKNPMQSGRKKTTSWIIAFEKVAPERPSSPMGWLSSRDMNQELTLIFPSLLKAVEHAKLQGWKYKVCVSPSVKIRPKAYENNFTCPRIRGESSSCNFLLS